MAHHTWSGRELPACMDERSSVTRLLQVAWPENGEYRGRIPGWRLICEVQNHYFRGGFVGLEASISAGNCFQVNLFLFHEFVKQKKWYLAMFGLVPCILSLPGSLLYFTSRFLLTDLSPTYFNWERRNLQKLLLASYRTDTIICC